MNKYSSNKIILLAGHTGYIGKLVLTKLIDLGYQVICVGRNPDNKNKTYLTRFNFYKTDICSKTELNKLKGEISKIDAVISCIGSRTGGKQDSWDVEFEANKNLLDLGYDLSCSHFILLSAICVQKPKLEFQFAKIAFENLLISSGMTYSIIRPTAYFKSLSGQIKNIKDGKSFVLFDSGLNTRCKPISENDLSDFICDCLVLDSRLNKILPIGGRGPAFTPQDQAEIIFKLVNKKPKYKKIFIGSD